MRFASGSGREGWVRCIWLKIPTEVSANRDRMRRFVQEAKAAALLNHPNIAYIYDNGEIDGKNFIAMEYLEGETLRQRLDERRLKVIEALNIGEQIAAALSAAHAAGIIHRDLKPENVMLHLNGNAKVFDFGVAKLIEANASPVDKEASTRSMSKTDPGTLIGNDSLHVPRTGPRTAGGRAH